MSGISVDRFLPRDERDASAASSLTGVPEFQVLEDTWSAIRDNYVESAEISDEDLIYGASRGMVDALGDTGHSRFLDPEEAEALDRATRGEFIGIGVEIDVRDGNPIIVAPLDNSPAAEAGLRAGDVILEINGEKTAGMLLTQVGQAIRGDEGTAVTLTIRHVERETSEELTLVRRLIILEPVSWSLLPEGIALIRLSDFTEGATDEMKAALEAAVADGATATVLDLRDNPGGLLHEAVGIASQFLAKDTVIFQEQDASGEVKSIGALGEPTVPNLPMAVLVNAGSASAAEIVAGALRDSGRATLIGETTYGTGTVLIPFELSDGSVALLGTELWLTSEGEQIWKEGIVPDQTVALPIASSPV
ncbi:MAG: S41 family peptidase, partial [Chloroflexia bacterium]|nr:S41 family peptidase [Chloroflexia bacterium]